MYEGNYLYRTKSNALYVINTEKKTVTGGVFGSNVIEYEKLQSSEKGNPLIILMADGTTLKTSPIVSYS